MESAEKKSQNCCGNCSCEQTMNSSRSCNTKENSTCNCGGGCTCGSANVSCC